MAQMPSGWVPKRIRPTAGGIGGDASMHYDIEGRCPSAELDPGFAFFRQSPH